MAVLSFLTVTAGPYLAWRTVTSRVIFDRIWNFVLLSLLVLATILLNFRTTGYTFHLSILLLLDFGAFLVLSPAQVLLFSRKPDDRNLDSLEIIQPEPDRFSEQGRKTKILVDIVAVHGLASNPKTTWKQGDNDWLRDFLPRESIPARIMAFNHNTAWESDALTKTLYDHGCDLLRVLARARRTREERKRPIIFIGHSFGGLIIKQALVSSNHAGEGKPGYGLCNHTKGFIFLGVPHKGSSFTVAGEIVSLLGHWKGSTVRLFEVMKLGSELNTRLHRDFMSTLERGCGLQNTVCVFEAVKESVFGVPLTHVVQRDSAVIDGCDEIGFESNHRGIQKYQSRRDQRYQDILERIQRWIREDM
ncbi:hypothetical protein BO70DRAFT_379376 [Aspergillus heteromorphus CBS 117.55]|uniref:DUF676 domain-containing protein n=1 Tax=Aspergillus heteromorphus CBS 117.55 TaxID=1448321 RepID=A0A317WBN8_9EURO|nr:uncharacterized protein BO70DRAFT_379376 [Aspergillus heteromorphus CBS 117.55]PWY83619.1 hypothetical protein BO70DRAFT_379376 [Aspergillus heteromorphus CBS 117.55]